MKFKNALLPATIAALLFSTNALASTGVINFTGNVIASPCDVDITLTTPAQSYSSTNGFLTAQLTLPDVTPASFPASGSYAGRTPFSIALTNCLAGAVSPTTVYTRFTSGLTASGDPAVLRNTDSSGATDVGIAILQSNGTAQIDINSDHQSSGAYDPGQPLPDSSGSAGDVTLNYVAAYKSLAASVGTGVVAAQTSFEIAYH
ncbi:fimbrial protein [Citrobacter amalonaticus]|uniref:fimbrial protein n=1 Tax=Citrobacter amalonaticus TaxID=35703 RepID=UPI001905462E|nr:fimbrial protein [Citrobacter amalonaticus]MBJ9256969.1 type 1 fimbrial protein [Citrobacter amalonaticus]MCP1629933.1 major type 1 subunit fimbrin (pilin) [Citrobacter amalonaticus]HAU5634540.1 type 1 fimbrial protein [Citrobacter amalonaticus]HDQ2809994.1 type 1 fimbrial protein [Citrobacter amalonaticus]